MSVPGHGKHEQGMNARQIPACEVRTVSTGAVFELSGVVSPALLAKPNAAFFFVCVERSGILEASAVY